METTPEMFTVIAHKKWDTPHVGIHWSGCDCPSLRGAERDDQVSLYGPNSGRVSAALASTLARRLGAGGVTVIDCAVGRGLFDRQPEPAAL